jgi:hypothetical protein
MKRRMADSIFALKEKERREFFQAASAKTGRLDTLIEKDIWVVWALSALYESPLGAHLVFKGGTSLSKGFGDLIKRFSEDVDLTYDIRELAPDLLPAGWEKREEPLPEDPAEAKKILGKIQKKRLPNWIKTSVLPVLEARQKVDKVNVAFRLEDEKLFIDYGKAEQGYVKPNVQLEFGARSTGEPAEVKAVTCYAEGVSGDILLPKAKPRIMVPRRTFWEKATAVHVFCRQSKPIAERLARHWYDLDQLDRAKVSDEAMADKPLARRVANFKTISFPAKDGKGEPIDYFAAVGGGLQLAPTGDHLKELEKDYASMREGQLLPEAAVSFAELMKRCSAIEAKLNAAMR